MIWQSLHVVVEQVDLFEGYPYVLSELFEVLECDVKGQIDPILLFVDELPLLPGDFD